MCPRSTSFDFCYDLSIWAKGQPWRSQNTCGKFHHNTVYRKVGQLKVNNNQVMCHLSMKLSDMCDQNPPYTFDKIREKTILMKNALTA